MTFRKLKDISLFILVQIHLTRNSSRKWKEQSIFVYFVEKIWITRKGNVKGLLQWKRGYNKKIAGDKFENMTNLRMLWCVYFVINSMSGE